ncbi:MAG: glycosyltransferase family 4 protein [Microcoleaceae cyanobacterium]
MVANSAGLKGQLQTFLATGLKNCRAIAAIGSRAVKDFQQRLPEMPIFNIPYYCSLEKFGQSLPERPRDPVTILFCGQMIRRKGVDLLLKAFENLVQSGFKARLLLVGREAELPQMLKLIDPKIQSQIHYAGFQAPENLPQFFQQADIFVLPSRYDGWGVVVNQALGAGLPIICSDQVGAAYDLIEPGINGEIFPSGDVKVLTQAMKTFLKKPGYIQLASQFSIKKSQGWHLEIGAQRWLNVLQNI